MLTARQKFKIGDRVERIKGSQRGTVTGFVKGDVYQVKITGDHSDFYLTWNASVWMKVSSKQPASKIAFSEEPVVYSLTKDASVVYSLTPAGRQVLEDTIQGLDTDTANAGIRAGNLCELKRDSSSELEEPITLNGLGHLYDASIGRLVLAVKQWIRGF